ncbi:hypothetical protein BU17DRAFT_70943 [Hysterangium stoloniferum]|nr:hypothetical protein BU17DRAFT_70943 [Hysterangium stoloniferum]
MGGVDGPEIAVCPSPFNGFVSLGKYLCALERTILVTSTKDVYPSQDLSSKSVVPAGYTDNMQGLDRPSPFKLTATKRPEKNVEITEQQGRVWVLLTSWTIPNQVISATILPL